MGAVATQQPLDPIDDVPGVPVIDYTATVRRPAGCRLGWA
jgi:hypothetical protein